MARIKHFIVLLLENRAFNHIFGFVQPTEGQEMDNLLTLDPLPSNLLDPSKPKGANNPSFQASRPAPFAVHDKEGPSHSFKSVNVQLSNTAAGPSAGSPASNSGFVKLMPPTCWAARMWWTAPTSMK